MYRPPHRSPAFFLMTQIRFVASAERRVPASLCSHQSLRSCPNLCIFWRDEIAFSELGYRKFPGLSGHKMARAVLAGERLRINPFLQSHQSVHQGFRTRWATGDMNVHGYESVDALEDIVALLKWS